MRARYWMMMTAFFLLGCRSDADKMAEFCLNFEKAVATSKTCQAMSQAVGNELDKRVVLYDTQLCRTTTACLPCKKASRDLLGRCGQDSDTRPVLERMNFSDTLRKSAQEAQEEKPWSFE